MKPLTPLEDATLRQVLSSAAETDGWLDLTLVCSNTARMLPDVRQAVARLQRRGLVTIDEEAPNTERWVRFVLPEVEGGTRGPEPGTPAP